ncbi:glycosyltransferase family 39 protein [Geomonas sp. Red69]|uniref:glycosyltransferase family 39 protein n=1 Tax=Geomonas diazotrophica TaxID=2843197 RepID=UPI001C105E07|nr:glycosyltransferase family 39 protein [Geomonas diazotrophica]MBU5637957.1 glycosyltransferase family 39 protein [Geomonas diazotrophica]
MNSYIKKLTIITVLTKAVILAVIWAGYYLVPFNVPAHYANFIYPIGEPVSLASAFKTWDANHYLYLADAWYSPYHISNAFYPLFPFLVRVVGSLTFGNNLVAGLILSTTFTVLSMVYLFRLIGKTHGEEVAYRSCLMLLAFPTSFYLGLVYTESLFLMLALMLLYYLRENKTTPSFICAFLLPLTRPTGILVIVPALAAILPCLRAKESFELKKLLTPAGFVAGYGTYLLLMDLSTGDPFAGFDAQKVFLANNSLLNLLHPIDWFLNNFVYLDFTLNGFSTSILNRVFFVFYAVVAVLSYKKLDKTMFAYLLVMGLVPAMTGSLTSYMRYVAMAFPLFVYLAIKLRGRMAYCYLIPCALVQVVFVLVHASSRWIA